MYSFLDKGIKLCHKVILWNGTNLFVSYLPALKYSTVGIFLILYFAATSGQLSTSHFTTRTFPSYSWEISSIIGATILQGPHHSAQKSTNTGLSDFITRSSKFISFTSVAMTKYILNILIIICCKDS